MQARRDSDLRHALIALLGPVLATSACTSPARDAFPDDPTAAATTTSASSGSSPSVSGSTSSSAGSSDGGGGEAPVGPGGNGPGGGDGGSSSGGGAPPACGEGDGVCVPATPAGWTGPFAIFENPTGIPTPSCAIGNYPEHLANFVGEIDEGSATCDCDCEPAQGIACFGNATLCYHSSLAECSQTCGGSSQSLFPNVCDTPDFPTIQYAAAFPPTPDDVGSCAEIVTADIVEATWAVETVACAGAAPLEGTCDDAAACVAIPSNDAARLCILHANDVDCPDVFTEKRLRYGSVTDRRSCTECVCGDAVSNCGSVDFTEGGCEGFVVSSIPANGCGEIWEGSDEDPSNVVCKHAPTGMCGHTGGEVQGEIERDGPATVCCIPAL